jgi:hypothetical protein
MKEWKYLWNNFAPPFIDNKMMVQNYFINIEIFSPIIYILLLTSNIHTVPMSLYCTTRLMTGFYTTNKLIKEKLSRDWYIEDAIGIAIFIPRTNYLFNSITPVIEGMS